MAYGSRQLLAAFACSLIAVAQVPPSQPKDLKHLGSEVDKSVVELGRIHKELEDLLPGMIELSQKSGYAGSFVETGGPLSIATYFSLDDVQLAFTRTLLACFDKLSCDADRAVVAGFISAQLDRTIESIEAIKSATESRLKKFRSLELTKEEAVLRDATVKVGDNGVTAYGDLLRLLKSVNREAAK